MGLRSALPSRTARLISASSLMFIGALWCVMSYVMVDRNGQPEPLVPHFFLPAPDDVVKSLFYLIYTKDLLGAVGVSALRIVKAFGLSLAVALPLGIAMGSFDLINRIFDPIIAPLRYLPITAFIPLLILWFGIDESQKVAFLFLGTVVYLLPAVVDAIRLVPDELVQTAFTLGATKSQVIRTVLIPAALPQIFDGFRVMNAIAWTYIILAEIVNPQSGVGYILRLAEQHLKPEWLFAGILVVGIIGILTDVIIRTLNRILFGWREIDA
jgi:NitT/TauT family transport system permease protein